MSSETKTTEQSLYEKREKIYPREVHGRFALLRTLAVIVLLGLFFILPWLEIKKLLLASFLLSIFMPREPINIHTPNLLANFWSRGTPIHHCRDHAETGLP